MSAHRPIQVCRAVKGYGDIIIIYILTPWVQQLTKHYVALAVYSSYRDYSTSVSPSHSLHCIIFEPVLAFSAEIDYYQPFNITLKDC